MLGLEVADARLGGGRFISHLTARGPAAHPPGNPDPAPILVVVAVIAPIDMDAARRDAGLLLQLGGAWTQGAVERVAVRCLRV